eukprot:232978_1
MKKNHLMRELIAMELFDSGVELFVERLFFQHNFSSQMSALAAQQFDVFEFVDALLLNQSLMKIATFWMFLVFATPFFQSCFHRNLDNTSFFVATGETMLLPPVFDVVVSNSGLYFNLDDE